MEINDNELVNLECVNLHRKKHFLINPVLLQCGHFMCFDCVQKKKNREDSVECGICKKMQKINLNNNPASFSMNNNIKSCVDQLFKRVNEKFNSSFTTFQGLVTERKERVELEFQNISKDIEKRAESLKKDIDEICRQFLNDVALKKEEHLSKINDVDIQVCSMKRDFENHKELKVNEKTTENLDSFQKQFEKIQDLISEISIHTKVEFHVSKDRCLDLELFGSFEYDDCSNYDKIHKTFNEEILIDIKPLDLCVLPRNQLLVADYLSNYLCLFDKNFKLIKKIQKINKNNFKPFALATNGINKIYISDHESNRILVTDLNFNLLNSIESNDLQNPNGLYYSNELLYVCDFYGWSIHVYKADLTKDSSVMLDFAPWYIKVIDNIVCIRHRQENSISFYKLPEFSVKYRYDGHNGFICVADNKFYEFYQNDSIIYCYNSDGTICCEDYIDLPDNFEIHDPIAYFNQKFVLASNLSNKFITQ